ncbi:hypothetical protein [Winogradskyella flava]|uniref:hypothetical protein n=1 Tax=Winogradskyella flava TaxID=1884876 RepID=UPI0024911B67|nr:hypothetical protein [Winogradskyella flava]
MDMWSYIGVISVVFVFYRFLKKLGHTIPILELLLLIAGLQWIVGAFIEYRTSFEHYKYYMYVEEVVYMSYVVPAYILFAIVVLYFSNRAKIVGLNTEQLKKNSSIGILLLIVGLFSDLIAGSVPDTLNFVIYLISAFKYIGVIILFFSNKKYHIRLFYFAILYLVTKALTSGFFHELILWGTFFYMFWAFKNKPTLRANLLTILAGFVISTTIQAVKSDYRTLIWSGYQGNYGSLFIEILGKRLSGGLSENKSEQEELNVRLNQGWIISAIMEHTPRVQSYAEGSTIDDAIGATLLPRFLSPNKKIAGGVENFEKYTGIELEDNTSMGMSLVGEGYANYGANGGIVFMVIWGLVIGLFWLFLIDKCRYNIVLYFFLPLIYLQVVKAETELVVVLNHLVKASILVFVFLWFVNKVLKIDFTHA